MNMRIDSTSATLAATLKRLADDGSSAEITYTLDEGLGGGGGELPAGSSNDELVKFYEAETAEKSGTTESKSGLLTASSDFSKIQLQGQNSSNLLSQNTVVSADVKDVETPILVAEQTNTSLPPVAVDTTTDEANFPNSSAQNAFSTIFPNGTFDKASFDKFISTVLNGKGDSDTISWGELNTLGNALGFEGNADLRNGSAIDAMMAHPLLGPALRELDPRQEKISVSGLKEALKTAFGVSSDPTYAPVTFTAAGYSSVLKSGKDSITGSYQAWKEMTLNGKLTMARVVRFLDNAIGGKTNLNNADLAGLAQKLGFDTLDTMLWQKNADGSDGLGAFLNQYRDASGNYSVPSDDFIAKYSNMLETAAGADGVSALDYNEYKAMLSDAYLFDTTMPVHVDGLTNINMEDASALTKFISQISGLQGGLNVPIDTKGNLVLTDADGKAKPIMAGAYAMAVIAKQLGYASLDAMMKSPNLQNILSAANENNGIKGFVNINLNTLINGSDTGIVHVQGLSEMFKAAAGTDNVLSNAERVSFVQSASVTIDPSPIDTTPVIIPVKALPIGVTQANAADFKTTIRNYLITKAREYDTDSDVKINADGSLSGTISKDAMNKIAVDMGFTGGLEQMKTHPELQALLGAALDNGGITGKLERYDISKLANGVDSLSTGLPDILLSAAHSDLTLSATDMNNFIALSGTGGVKPIRVPDTVSVGDTENFADVMKAAGFTKVANPQDYEVSTGTDVYTFNGKAYKAVVNATTDTNQQNTTYSISEVQLKSTTTPVDPIKLNLTFPNIKPLARLDKELTAKGYTKVENPTDYGISDGRPVYMINGQAYVFTSTRPNSLSGKITFTVEAVALIDHAPPIETPPIGVPSTDGAPVSVSITNGSALTIDDQMKSLGYSASQAMNGQYTGIGAGMTIYTSATNRTFVVDSIATTQSIPGSSIYTFREVFASVTSPIKVQPPIETTPVEQPVITDIFADAVSGGNLDELMAKLNDKLIAGAKSIPVTVSSTGDGTLNVDQLAAFMKKLAPSVFTDLDKVLLHPDLKDLISAAKIAGSNPVQYDVKVLVSGLSALLGKAASPGDPSTLSVDEKDTYFKKTITAGTETPPIIAPTTPVVPSVPPTTLTPIQQAQWNMLSANLKRRNVQFDPNSSIEQLRALVDSGSRIFRSRGGKITNA